MRFNPELSQFNPELSNLTPGSLQSQALSSRAEVYEKLWLAGGLAVSARLAVEYVYPEVLGG